MSAIVVFSNNYKYFFYPPAVDMRKSFHGLCGVAERDMHKRVEKNKREIFIFLNKARTHIKLLLHENDGFTLLYRTQKKQFSLPDASPENGTIFLTSAEVMSLLGGLTLHRSEKRA